MTLPNWNSSASRVGLLYQGDGENGTFLGSGFCLIDAKAFITAAQCVREVPLDQLWVNHHGGPSPDLFTRAHDIQFAQACGLTVVTTDAPGSRWVTPFTQDLGSRVASFGYPNQSITFSTASREAGRLFRGYVQRPFLHQSKSGCRYSAYELSFPCPSGLSG